MKRPVKIIKNLKHTLLLMIFFTTSSWAEHPSERALQSVLKELTSEIHTEYGLSCSGEGGSKKNTIDIVELSFIAHRRASVEEARQLHIKVTEKLIEKLSSSKELEPYLSTQPLSHSNCHISISYRTPHNHHYADGSVALSTYGKGMIFYERAELFDSRLHSIFNESYQEAAVIVNSHPLAYGDREHQEVGYEKELDRVLNQFAEKVYKKYGIYCENYGGRISSQIEEVGVSLVRKKSTPLQKARQYEVEITHMLLDIINSNTQLRPFLSQYPFTARQTPIRIVCYDKKGMPFQDGSVTTTIQKEGKIGYYREKPATQLCPAPFEGALFLEESFQEAEKTLRNNKKGFFH
jgi:hypothetical protein